MPANFATRLRHKLLQSGRNRRVRQTVQRQLMLEQFERRDLMATFTWDGGGANGNWMTAANWVGNVAPTAGDDLVFTGSVRTTNSNNYAAGTIFNSITFGSGAANFSISGNRVSLNGGGDLGSVTGSHVIALPLTIDNASTVDVTAGQIKLSGVISGAGSLSKTGNADLMLAGANTFSGGVTIKAGTVIQTTSLTAFGTGSITIGDSVGNADATLKREMQLGTLSNTIQVASGNTGKASIATSFNGASVVFSGAVILNGHDLTLSSGGTSRLVLRGGISGNGDLSISSESSGGVQIEQGLINHNGSIVNSGGGTGSATVSASVGSNVSTVVQNSSTSALKLSNSNAFAGVLSIKAGTVEGSASSAFGTGTIAIGDSTGSTDSTLNASWGGPVNNPISIVAGNSGIATITSATAPTFTGLITLNNHDLVFSGTGSSNPTLRGGTAGTGNLILASMSTGHVQAWGPGSSFDHHGKIINAGTGTGHTIIDIPIGGNITEIVQVSATSPITVHGSVTVNNMGTVITNNGNQPLSVQGGIVGVGNLTLRNNSNVLDGIRIEPNEYYIGTPGDVSNNGSVINVGSGAGNVIISAPITSNVTGIEQDSLTSALTVTGVLTVNSSTTTVSNESGGSSVNIAGGIDGTGNLVLKNNSDMADAIILQAGAIENIGLVSNTGSGTGSVKVNSVIGTNVNGVVQNSSNSTLILAGVNTYTSATTIYAGTAIISGSGTFGASSSPLTLDGSSAVANLNALTRSVGAVSLRNGGTISNGTLTGSSYSVETGTISAILAGSGIALTKSTSGTVTLSGTNTYTGTTTVSGGTLLVNGSLADGPATNDVVVDSGASLGGTGTIHGAINSSSTIAPGNGPGVLAAGKMVLNSGAEFAVELGGTSPGSGSSNHDQLIVSGNSSGSVTIGSGVALDVSAVNSFHPQPGDSFVIINNTDSSGSVSGTFDGLAEGATFATPAGGFQISYVGGSGNDVVLTATGPAVAIGNASLVSEGTSATFTVTLSSVSSNDVTVYYSTGTGTAGSGDFTGATSSIVILAGQLTGDIVIATTDDSLDEATESFTVTLTSVTNGILGGAVVGTGTISDNDPTPNVTIANAAAVTEGTSASFTVTLSAASGQDVIVYYATAAGTAGSTDFTSATSSITITAGSSSGLITIATNDDGVHEASESFTVSLTSATNATLGGATVGSGTINDNDPTPTVSISASTSSFSEKSEAGTTVTFTRSGDTSEPLLVNYSYGGSGASPSTNFYGPSSGSGGTVEIPAGSTTATITLRPIDDASGDGDQGYSIELDDASGYDLGGTSSANFTVTDEDDDYYNYWSTPSPYMPVTPGNVKQPCGCEETDPATGSLASTVGSGDAMLVNYTAANPHPIIAQNVTFNSAALTADVIHVSLTLGSLSPVNVYYDPASIVPGEPLRIAIQLDASALATGRYDWTMTVTADFASGPDSTQTLTGHQDIRNLIDSVNGNRWSPAAVARLEVDSSGALLTEGNGEMSWFHLLSYGSGDYVREMGVSGFYTLTTGFGEHIVTHADKSYRRFDSDGLLVSSVDARGRETTYTYVDGDGDTEVDEIETITDPLGRTTTFAYSSDKLASTTDFAGRTTSYTFDVSGRLTEVTMPDPDGVGPLTSAVVEYTYDSVTNLLTSVTNGEGETTTYTYHEDRTLDTTTYPDGRVEVMNAALRSGLVIAGATVGSLGTPASFAETADVSGMSTDPAGSQTAFEIDGLGYILKETDELGNVKQYIRNADGQVVAMFLPDPDGAGPMMELRTFYHYDTLGNIVFRTNPDGTTESWSYNSTWNKLESYTDPLGRLTTYDIDSGTGDVLVIRRVVGLNDASSSETDDTVTTFAYTPAPTDPSDPPAGLVATMWDPLGVITNYEYNAHALLTKVTYAATTALETFVEFEYDAADNLIASIDELGRRTEYDYDHLGRMTSMTLPDPDQGGPLTSPVYTYEYDKADRLIKSYDPLNRLTEYVYNSLGQLEEIIAPDHDGDTNRTVTTFAYDTAGRLDEIIDALGYSHTSVFDELSRVTEMHAPSHDGIVSGPVYKTSYGALGWKLSTTDPLDNVTNYIYENFGKKVTVKQVNPATGEELTGPTSIAEYDAVGNLVRATDALGRVTTYEYDSLDRLITVTQPDPTDDSVDNPPVTSYTYDMLGRLKTVTDPLSNVTTYTYDERGRLTNVRLPNITTGAATGGPETTYEYDDAGQLIGVTNALNDETTFTYDDLGRLLTKVLPDPDGAGPLGTLTTTYAYDAVGNLTKVTDARGNFSEYAYDDHDNLVEITLPDPDDAGPLTSPVWAFTYDDLGNKLTAVDPLGYTTTYEYDDLNRLTRTTSPDPDGVGAQLAPRVDYTYDLAGNLLTVTDRLGHGSTYAYDHLHRRTSVTNANSEVTAFTYDAIGNLLSLTDPEENTTAWTYDALNRAVSETDELNATRTFAYDNAGNLTSKTDRLGRVTEYTYDHLHRQTAELWKDGGSTVRTMSYGYDALGQLLNVADPAAEYDYEYDAIGRLTQATTDLAGLTSLVGLTSVYDAVGNRLSLAATVGATDDFINSYTYDDLDRLTRIQQEAQSGGNAVSDKRVDLAYNAVGQWDTITRYQSQDTSKLVASSSFAYDQTNRLTSIDHTRSTTDLAGYDYTYDAANRITSIDSFLDGLSEFTYDSTSQLTGADHTSQADEAYEYDDNGNRVMSGHTVDSDNRLLSDGTYNYTYDAEGNRVSRTEIATGVKLEYTWDYRNRLTLVTYKDDMDVVTKKVAYEYDAFDRRVRKQVDDTGNGTWDRGEQYVYDGDHIALVFDDAGDLLRRNLHGDAIDQILASEFVDTTNETNWYLADHLGTVRDVYSYDDLLSDIVSEGHIEYDSFGNIVAGDAAAEKAGFSYTGREWDADAQLYYYRKRWFDAATGQFVSKDPIGFEAADSNVARYVQNSPLMHIDPFGLQAWGPQQPRQRASSEQIAWAQAELARAAEARRLANIPQIGAATTPPSRLQEAIGRLAYYEQRSSASNRHRLLMERGIYVDPPTDAERHQAEIDRTYIASQDPMTWFGIGMDLMGAASGVAGGPRSPTVPRRETAWGSPICPPRSSQTALINPTNQYGPGVSPHSINFSQHTIDGRTARAYENSMRSNQWDWSRNGPIRVMDINGQLVTYDNRRLWAAQRQLDTIPILRVQPTDPYPGRRYNTWEDAFNARFNDSRNIEAGGSVPATGISRPPQLLPY